MATELPTLAVEVVEVVAGALDPTDLFSLRLACKELNRKTLSYFGRTYLTIVRTDLSRKSLQKLQEISENEQFRNRVETLLVKKWEDDLGRGFWWHRNPAGQVEGRLPGVQMLRDILHGKLVNCRSFHIHSLGGMEENYGSEGLMPSDAIGIILAIIAETSLPVKAFRVDFRSRGTGRVDAKRLQMALYSQPAFRSAWAHLQELCLDFSMMPDTFDWAKDLILHTTSLRKLSLHFEFDHSASFLGGLLSSAHLLQSLEDFRLGCAYITVDTLSSLLLHFRDSLRAVSFRHVCVNSGTWVTILRELRRSFPLLESISVDWLKEYSYEERIHIMFPTLSDNLVVPDSQGRKFTLKYKKWKGAERVWGVSYHGRAGMNAALEVLAKSAEHT